VILAGHSMARIELCHFAALYPERVIKLVFLDAAYDNASPDAEAMLEKDPLPKMIPAWPEDGPDTIEAYNATSNRLYPSQAAIWGQVMDEQTRHTLKTNADGKVVEKMSEIISKAIQDTLISFSPDYSSIQAPILSIFAIYPCEDFLSSDYMTEKQKDQVRNFFETVLQPYLKQYVEQFQRKVPYAQVIEIPNGHHYCFIKNEEIVFHKMRKFLLEA
jgi:non-heme chloroperoxidase